jgi:hypothetical protein
MISSFLTAPPGKEEELKKERWCPSGTKRYLVEVHGFPKEIPALRNIAVDNCPATIAALDIGCRIIG